MAANLSSIAALRAEPAQTVLPPATTPNTHLQRALSSPETKQHSPELREAFDQFVGQAFYSQLIKSMRSSVGKPAYFHGGRAEEIFQSQLDQHYTESLAESSGNQLSDAMFELFLLPRPS